LTKEHIDTNIYRIINLINSKEIGVQTLKTIFLALTLVAFAAGGLWAAETKPAPAAKAAPPAAAPGQPQTQCPVLGGKINKNVYADYKGQRIYFCCAGCDKEFKKDPEKYLKKLRDQGITLEPAPAKTAKK
jgi:YHS domain-containing protein